MGIIILLLAIVILLLAYFVYKSNTSSSTSSYVIKEDGTILRQDNEIESDSVDQNDITNTNPFSLENNNRLLITSIQTQEEATQEEFILRKRMLAGEQIEFSQCNGLLDTVDDFELWELIVKNHISQPNRPPVDLINNYSSERAIDFMEMIYRIVSSCVATNSEFCQLSPEFLKNIIVFSKNIDALYCIADMQESDLIESKYDEDLFNELKRRAYNRYNFLTTKRNKHYGNGF
ncbi:MAG: hypothetical protein IJ816_01090 [Alloprevotella sp.]|nr:hypothetical protein [Alloprevotella sp.]